MEAVIINFRRSKTRASPNHMILEAKEVKTKAAAEKLVGKKVTFTTPAKRTITGKVAAAHGNSGAMRAIFEKGMPGQAIGQKVSIE